MRRRLIALMALVTALVLASFAASPSALAGYLEAPELAAQVQAGSLPSLTERLPEPPFVDAMDQPWQATGKYGGQLRLLMGKSRDLRQMTVYGYARLVGYNADLELVPDILERVEIEDNRVFTFHLRRGHKWSDGHPFTTADFRYWWDDVANNEELSPAGIPNDLLIDGDRPTFEVLDETRVRYTWSDPNPTLLHALAGARPLYLYAPAHYLKQFHTRYAGAAALEAMVAEKEVRNWAALHSRMDNAYKNNNPALPTLQPWVNTTKPPSERFVFKRNPYFHRVDPEGRQLPYIDEVVVYIAGSSIIPAKVGAGASDLQARYIRFDNYTFLKATEERQKQRVRLWKTARGARIALYPNLNVNDDAYRTLFRDVRFRRALSLAIHRHEINEVVFFGLAIEGNNTVLPSCPLFRKEYQLAWAEFDPDRANGLLDEIGLGERDDRGIRLFPDGRALEIIVESAGESTEETDVLELIADSWADIGVKLHTKPSQREVFRNRIFAGDTQMSIWTGLENALPNPDMSPVELAPMKQDYLQWPKWGQYVQTKGLSGEAIDMPEAQELSELYHAWERATERIEREKIWHRMLQIHADQIFTIGVVAGVPQPVVINELLRNLPETGLYNWDPGAFFGIYHPDSLWFDTDGVVN
jgi:peptide/nickel transport system substrate-binding protein